MLGYINEEKYAGAKRLCSLLENLYVDLLILSYRIPIHINSTKYIYSGYPTTVVKKAIGKKTARTLAEKPKAIVLLCTGYVGAGSVVRKESLGDHLLLGGLLTDSQGVICAS